MDSPERRAQISLEWLVRLRWGAVAGQSATLLGAQLWLGAQLPLPQLVSLVALLAASNLALSALRRHASPRALCGAALSFDTLQLTGLLYATGGAYNPFSVLYLVYITLAAVVLGARWTWFLAAFAVACYATLFASHIPLEHLDHAGPEMRLHLQGMWIAFVIATVLTAYFVVRLSSAIERQAAQVAAMREEAARTARIASITALAAGAAHEMGTPLATIAVAARELERAIGSLPDDHARALAPDAALIRSELGRCRAILDRLATDVGLRPGEAPVEVHAPDLVADVLEGLSAPQRARLSVEAPANVTTAVRLPRSALLQVAQCLLSNAFQAGGAEVRLAVDAGPEGLRLVVRDEGAGMAPDVLARAGEPFFSTRPAGQGLGLGLFIARTLTEQMAGTLTLDARPGAGTTATVRIPGVPVAGAYGN
jgi:two-component system sensor histidine kinase RegB